MLVLLDLDGTLTDPYEGITKCVAHALDSLGQPRLEERALRSFIGPPLQDQFASLGLDEGGVARAVELYRERFRDQGLYENCVYEGVPDALQALAAVPLRLGVATSKPTPFAERILRHFGLDEHLDLVAGATLDGRRRMKADIISFALTALDVDAADAVMVGDRAQDVDGARAVGMSSIGVTWGYAEPGELEAAGADQIVATPDALVGVLLERHRMRHE
ncbi:MAG: HAD-IA family hydrolase [Mycobacteriales bacterium]